MKEEIRNLSDEDAIRILTTIARNQMREGNYETKWTPEIQKAVSEYVGTEPVTGTVTEGDIAREALTLISDLPEYKESLHWLITGPQTKSFLDPGLVGVIEVASAVMVMLQVGFKFDIKIGKFKGCIEKKSADDKVLISLIEKIGQLFKFKGKS